MTNKSVAKTIRLTEEVYTYIENYEGDTFTGKLEHLVLDACLGEQQRREKFRYYDDQIRESQQELNRLLLELETVRRIRREAISVEAGINRLSREVQTLLEAAGAGTSGGSE